MVEKMFIFTFKTDHGGTIMYADSISKIVAPSTNAGVFPVVASLHPKSNVSEPEPLNIFVT